MDVWNATRESHNAASVKAPSQDDEVFPVAPSGAMLIHQFLSDRPTLQLHHAHRSGREPPPGRVSTGKPDALAPSWRSRPGCVLERRAPEPFTGETPATAGQRPAPRHHRRANPLNPRSRSDGAGASPTPCGRCPPTLESADASRVPCGPSPRSPPDAADRRDAAASPPPGFSFPSPARKSR